MGSLLSRCRRTTSPVAENVPYFTFRGKQFVATPCHIYDGDTFSVVFQYRGEWIKYRCRCLGYDSPEMKPRLDAPGRDEEKESAQKAKMRLSELLHKHPSKKVRIECGDFDKYGRILVTVWNQVDPLSINQQMLQEGHSK